MRIPDTHANGLEATYSHDEPEYTLGNLITANPHYAGFEENKELDLKLPPNGLEAAYGHDEPEYTSDNLVTVNPDYEKV